MKFRFGLRARMLVAYTSLIVVGFLLLALYAGRQVTQGATVEYQSNLPTQALLVARGLSEPLEHYREGELDQASLILAVNAYAEQLDARVTLIDDRGRAWVDSKGEAPAGDFSAQPEVEAALKGRATYGSYPDEAGTTTLYTAAPIMYEGRIFGAVRLSTTAVAPNDRLTQRWVSLALGALLLGLLALIASWWVASSQTRPLEQLRHSAIRMADGDFSTRLPEDRQDEVGELAAAFNHMAARVQAMVEEQRAFASNAAHELRTPLTAIRLRSEALREGTADAEIAEQYVAEIDDEAVRMGNLVSDLILLSRFDAGRPELGSEQIDPVRLARALVNEVSPRAERQHIAVTLSAAEGLPPISASQNHLRVVFYNLLDNALKYTPDSGEIHWRLWLEDGFVRSEIRDTGQGIAPEDLPHLFERFYRADKARARTVSGTGLGLALVRSVIHAYGGRIVIDSPGLGQGTIADVWWPVMENSQGTPLTIEC